MEKGRLIERDGAQFVELPPGFRMSGDRVYFERQGENIVLHSKDEMRRRLSNALNDLSPDYADVLDAIDREDLASAR